MRKIILLIIFLVTSFLTFSQVQVSGVTSYKAQLNWPSMPNVMGFVLVRGNTAMLSAPEDGIDYQQGDYLGDDQVAYAGTVPSFLQKSLRASRSYFYQLYTKENGGGSPIYIPYDEPFVVQTPFNMVGSYYDTIDSTQTNFITDLQDRIRSPYTKISYNNYDETMIADFASEDTADGQKVITCVYSQYHHVYTPPFDWLPISREHTYCHSWMPSYSGTGTDEYADQHHLFPTQQNNANGVRSNHPLGEVVNVQSSFHLGKLGFNDLNQVVYEPREVQKGDAARALLYMAMRYDGLDGLNWTFNQLNNVVLPNLSEAPQSLETLLEWHFNDLPDDYERARNDYIQSIQQNRNPFIDHPYWVNLIDFHDLTYVPIDTTEIVDTTDTSTVLVKEILELPYQLFGNGSQPVLVLKDNQSTAKMLVYNTMGKLVLFKENESHSNASSGIFSFRDLANGTYVLKLNQGGQEYHIRIVVNNL